MLLFTAQSKNCKANGSILSQVQRIAGNQLIRYVNIKIPDIWTSQYRERRILSRCFKGRRDLGFSIQIVVVGSVLLQRTRLEKERKWFWSSDASTFSSVWSWWRRRSIFRKRRMVSEFSTMFVFLLNLSSIVVDQYNWSIWFEIMTPLPVKTMVDNSITSLICQCKLTAPLSLPSYITGDRVSNASSNTYVSCEVIVSRMNICVSSRIHQPLERIVNIDYRWTTHSIKHSNRSWRWE